MHHALFVGGPGLIVSFAPRNILGAYRLGIACAFRINYLLQVNEEMSNLRGTV